MLFLNVPYSEKDEAKRLGARWDREKVKWYVRNKEDYYKFMKWIGREGNLVIIDHLYLIEGVRKCFRCKNETRVIGFGFDKHLYSLDYDNRDEDDLNLISSQINQEDLFILGPINPIPSSLLEYIQSNYNYKLIYSNVTKDLALRNGCEHCDCLQGDFHLFVEPEPPFTVYSKEDAQKLKIYKIDLKQDLIVYTNNPIFDCSNAYMYKKYGNIIPLDIKL